MEPFCLCRAVQEIVPYHMEVICSTAAVRGGTGCILELMIRADTPQRVGNVFNGMLRLFEVPPRMDRRSTWRVVLIDPFDAEFESKVLRVASSWPNIPKPYVCKVPATPE